MTRAGSLLLTGLLIATLAVLPAVAGPSQKGVPAEPAAPKMMVRHAGDLFCPTKTLVAGNVIIPAGQCFMLSVLRDRTGTFLAFVPPEAKIPPGQLVRLNTPAGPKLKGRLFLIPLSTKAPVVPLNTMTLVGAQIQDLGTLVRVVLTGLSTPVPPVEIHER